jgi:hypothetical protein
VSDRDITEEKPVQPYAPYVRRPCSEAELLEKMQAMYPHLATAIRAEFAAGYKKVMKRRKK